jgi:CRP/FNR family transcriptional regulator
MPVNLPTNLLRSFVAIVDTGSMLNASEKVFVTQSALSLQIKRLEELLREIPALQHHFHKIMSRDIMRDQGLMLVLAGMKADARLSAFLIGLSQRFANLGYSAMRFRLRMTREEIGSYLGLTLETVSRLFSRFSGEGWIRIDRREIEILDFTALRGIIEVRE